MMTNVFRYAVSLQIKHPHVHPEHVCAELGSSPEYSWVAGEPRKTPKGTPLSGVYKENYCIFDMGSGHDGALVQSLDRALQELHSKGEYLRHLRSTGGTLMFYVFWYPNGDTGAVFQADLLMRMADLGISLGINVYELSED
ncbi:DUF4279 domain-containing protein [Aminobacter aminovorans]|uniref:DUF4279 domain-containing protein n=1 Tax=Aminobacter aminovorans TaxID=83263 RepID=UPI00286184E4|nr:DUF4279 domain-containing protein [Aminobacter aminovorans]MDR7219960.1 hypothetical protein [Aminobacter aminovorans]